MTPKKITLATFKSIIKNKDCELKVKSSFDGMTDCVQGLEDTGYRKIPKSEIDFTKNHTLGIPGIWLVGSSRDGFSLISENEIEVYNCCGSFNIKFN